MWLHHELGWSGQLPVFEACVACCSLWRPSSRVTREAVARGLKGLTHSERSTKSPAHAVYLLCHRVCVCDFVFLFLFGKILGVAAVCGEGCHMFFFFPPASDAARCASAGRVFVPLAGCVARASRVERGLCGARGVFCVVAVCGALVAPHAGVHPARESDHVRCTLGLCTRLAWRRAPLVPRARSLAQFARHHV